MLDTLLRAIMAQLQQPKQDLEHNLRAVLSEALTQMDVVTQQALERQSLALQQAQQRLAQLQQQLDALEQRNS